MLVRLPTSYNDQGLLPMSFNEAGDNLQRHPNQEQPHIEHSNQGKYSSAYNIGFCCDTYPSMLMCVM